MTAYPDGELDAKVELLLGEWTDVTAGAWPDGAQYAQITFGQQPGAPQMQAASMPLTLSNPDWRYSPRNASGPYYGLLRRNVPARVSVASPYGTSLRLEAGNADRAYVSDNASLDIAGSIEMRIVLRLSDWRGGVLACKWDGGGCWTWTLNPDGTMAFYWLDASVTERSVTSAVPVPYAGGDMALRVTMDAATGTVAFYAGTAIDGTWTQLGNAASGTGGAATSVQVQHGSQLQVGWSYNFAPGQISGRVREYRLYNGIGGTVAADGVFTSAAAGAASWTDAQGNLWQLAGGAEISDRDYRLHGELGSITAAAVTPSAASVQTVVSGRVRRLVQGQHPPVDSAMKRAVITQAGALAPVACWPMEEPGNPSQFGAAVGPWPMTFTPDPAPLFASDSSFLASGPLPALNGSRLQGRVASYPATGTWVVRFLLKVSPSGDSGTLVRVAAGAVAYVNVESGGGMELVVYTSDGTEHSTGYFAFPGNTTTGVWCSLEAQPASGGGVQYSLVTLQPGAPMANEASLTVASQPDAGVVRLVQFAPQNGRTGSFASTVVGHCSVQSAWSSLFSLREPLNAWQGEAAAVRFGRICGEQGIPCRIIGSPAASALMGPQPAGTVQEILQDCADTGQGLVFEPRDVLGIGYRTLASMCNQAPAVTLDFAASTLPGNLQAADDDQDLRNDWTVTMADGTQVRTVLSDGSAQSAAEYADGGSGAYQGTATANTATAGGLLDAAGWMQRASTPDEARYRQVTGDFGDPGAPAADMAQLRPGDLLVLTSPPGAYQSDDIRQLPVGGTETLGPGRSIRWNCTPASPYDTGTWDSAHYDSAGSVLAGTLAAPLGSGLPGPEAAGWSAYGGTLAPVPAPAPSDVPWWAAWTSDGTAFGNVQAPAVPVTAGQEYVISGLLYSPAARTLNPGFGWFSATAHLSDDSAAVTVPAGVITPFCAGPFTAPAGSVTARPQVQDFAPAAGDQFTVTALTAWPATSAAVPVARDTWTTDAADFPFDIKAAGERMTVISAGPGTSRTGAYLSPANYGSLDFSGRAALWQSWSGHPVTVTRAYLGSYGSVTTDYSYSSNLQEMVTAGTRICLSLQPGYNPVSAADLASIKTLLATLKNAGADVQVTLWHEPEGQGLTAAQYLNVIAYYGPSVRQFYPLWTVLGFNGSHPSAGYYPAASAIDGIACDQYFSAGITTFPTSQLVSTAAYADQNNLPLGIWELNVSPGPNYLTGDNYSFTTTKGNWGGSANTGSTFWSSLTRPFGGGTGAMKFSALAAGDMTVQSAPAANWATQMQACTAGDEITVGAWAQAVAAARSFSVGASFYTSAGAFVSTVYSTDASATATDVAGGWAAAAGKLTAPATAAFYAVNVKVKAAAAGETHAVTFAYGADSTSTGFTQADGTSFFAWIQAFMAARTVTWKQNGDIILFSGGVPGNSSATAVLHSSDYRIGLWSTLRAAFDGTSGPQQFTLARAVNGVSKAHAIGEAVSVHRPLVWTP